MNNYANLGKRLVAAIFDEIILVLVIYLTEESIDLPFLENSILTATMYSSYFILLHHKQGQTLGKKIMSIKVVSNTNENNYISLLNSFKRDSIPYLLNIFWLGAFYLKDSSIVFQDNYDYYMGLTNIIWIALEIISPLFNNKKRAIHDLIGNSVVIKQ